MVFAVIIENYFLYDIQVLHPTYFTNIYPITPLPQKIMKKDGKTQRDSLSVGEWRTWQQVVEFEGLTMFQ